MGNCLDKYMQTKANRSLDNPHPAGLTKMEKFQPQTAPDHPALATSKKLMEERRQEIDNPFKVDMKDEMVLPQKLTCFCYKTLKTATDKFSEKNLLGQGGFGDVYIGWIDYCTKEATKPGCGYPIAIKRLKKEGQQGLDEWKTELQTLSKLDHPHVVKLIGYCSEGKHRILVYEFMPKGSLAARLSEKTTELNWRRRMKIAIGLAKGLEYLHTMDKPIIHRDMKTANILLDNDFNPKIADFGLAKCGPVGDETHVSTRVLGTKGYFAPEYIGTGRLTFKTDVYSFGVVLLEILSGSTAIKIYRDGKPRDLAQWALPYLKDRQKLHLLIDRRLGKNLQMEEAYQFAGIVLQCLNIQPKCRPTMTEVVRGLEQIEQNMNGWNQSSLRTNTYFQQRSHRSQFTLETTRHTNVINFLNP